MPLLPFLKVVSSWGLGLREIIEAQKGTDTRKLRTDRPMSGDLTIDRNA